MTDIPLWQRQRDALQAEAQAAEAADAAAIAEIETALERLTQVTDLIRVQLRDSHGTLSIPVGGAMTYTTSTEQAASTEGGAPTLEPQEEQQQANSLADCYLQHLAGFGAPSETWTWPRVCPAPGQAPDLTLRTDPAPPLTRAQIAQDLARYGHDPSVLLREWDAYTQRIGARAAQDRLQLGAAIYRPARPDETPDLWVSDAHEGSDCQGYVRL